MTLFITEFPNLIAGRSLGFINPTPGASYGLSSAAAGAPTPGSNYIRVTADAGMLMGILASSTVALTSTNGVRIGANQPPEYFALPLSTAMRIMSAST